MAAVLAHALRRTSARVVLAVGAFGLLWTGGVMGPFIYDVGKGTRPMQTPSGVYRLLGSGFSFWDLAAAALVAALSLVVAVVLYREPPGRERSAGR